MLPIHLCAECSLLCVEKTKVPELKEVPQGNESGLGREKRPAKEAEKEQGGGCWGQETAPLCPGTLLSCISFPLHCRLFTQEKLGFSQPFSWSHTHSSLFTSSSLIGKLLPQKGRNLAFHLASSNSLFNALYPLLQVLGHDRLYFPQWPQQYFRFTGLSPLFR